MGAGPKGPLNLSILGNLPDLTELAEICEEVAADPARLLDRRQAGDDVPDHPQQAEAGERLPFHQSQLVTCQLMKTFPCKQRRQRMLRLRQQYETCMAIRTQACFLEAFQWQWLPLDRCKV